MEKNLYKVMVLIERIDVGGEGPPSLNGEHMYGKTEAGHLVFAACHSKADTIQAAVRVAQKLFDSAGDKSTDLSSN